jgi:EAL domain-containing protein (putative c-di-GMP-specific phosphodiesterase class I)
MTVAADLFEAKAQNRLQLAWQPVRHAVETGDILYYECLLRIIDANGDLQTPDRFLPSLERLGLMRALDRHVVLSVIDELRADSTIRLGANVSAQSAVDDVWWNGIFETLRTNRKLASRLVVEITETAAFPSIPQAVHFIASLRALGCVVALDDFGMGHSSIRQLITLQPNMVKIDAFFVRHARRSRDGRKCLEHLIGLASTIAGDVVIEGIESDEQSTLAKVSGGLWQQGYHHGCPAVTRPSKFGRIVEPSDGIGCHAPETLFSRPGDTVVLPARFHPLGLLWAIPIGLVLWAAIIGAGLGIWRVLP